MSASTNQLRVEQRRALDKPTRALASLSRFDYADRFILTTTTHATPQAALWRCSAPCRTGSRGSFGWVCCVSRCDRIRGRT
jgi:hypothetical protein